MKKPSLMTRLLVWLLVRVFGAKAEQSGQLVCIAVWKDGKSSDPAIVPHAFIGPNVTFFPVVGYGCLVFLPENMPLSPEHRAQAVAIAGLQ